MKGERKMSISELYKSNSNWIKAEDLRGKQVKVVIDKVELEEIGTSGYKVVLHFVGKEKALVLNATNAKCLASVLGDNEAEWIAKEIIMYPTTTEFGGKTVACIRVRVEAPEASDEESIPF